MIQTLNASGIYQISNSINNKIYIGSAVTFRIRFNKHRSELCRNIHHSVILQRHVNKYGIETLKFDVLEYVETEKLIKTEQKYIDLLKPQFNVSKIAGSSLGMKRSEITKQRMRDAKRKPRNPRNAKDPNRVKRDCSHMKGKVFCSWEGKTHKEESKRKIGLKLSKSVSQFSLNGDLIQTFVSTREAGNITGITFQKIGQVCLGKRKTAGGYVWKYV